MRINIDLDQNDPRAPKIKELGFYWCNKDCRFEGNVRRTGGVLAKVAHFLLSNPDVNHSLGSLESL